MNAPLLWAVVMALLSLLPAIADALIRMPAAIFLQATGAIWQGLNLIAFGAFVVSLVDNFLRPMLVGKGPWMQVRRQLAHRSPASVTDGFKRGLPQLI